MKTRDMPKTELDNTDTLNATHTKDANQKSNNKSKNNIIEAYDLLWNVDKKNKEESKAHTLLEEILLNASYVYVEKNPLK